MVGRQGLRDDRRERIKDLLPGRKGATGATAKDNRSFAEAVLYRCRARSSAARSARRFGDLRVVHARHTRWSKSGAWQKVFEHLALDADNETPGSTRRLSASTGTPPTRKGGSANGMRRASNGWADHENPPHRNALGNPTGFHLTSGQARDLQGADALLPGILDNIQSLLADPSDDARERVLDLLKRAEVEGVIPPRSNRTDQRDHDEDKHAWRHLIRNRFAKLKLRARLAPGSV